MPVRKAMPVRRAYADLPSGQIHLRRAGDGTFSGRPPLLCLHMSPASGHVYERFLAAMGEDRLAIAPDTPGFGHSDPLPEFPEIADYARTMWRLMDTLGLTGPVDLMGYHTGSLTIAEMARQAPERARRLILVSAPLYTEAERAELRALYRPGPVFTADGQRLLELWRWFLVFFRVGQDNTLEDAARIFYERLSGRERHWWGHRAAFNYDLAPVLSALAHRVTVLNPDDDLAANTPRAAPLLRDGRVLDLPGFTHGFLDTRTVEAARLVRELLD
jgi:pimeloyl-ACP methyl ester carboxylesterase